MKWERRLRACEAALVELDGGTKKTGVLEQQAPAAEDAGPSVGQGQSAGLSGSWRRG